jgi:hypothetical protein
MTLSFQTINKPHEIMRLHGFFSYLDFCTSQLQPEQFASLFKDKADAQTTNYLLLSYIIEKIDRQTYEAAVQKNNSQTTFARMTTMIDDYGMGIFPYNFDGAKGFGHYGRVEEFYTALRLQIKEPDNIYYLSKSK